MSIDGDYFVMLTTQNCNYTPLMNGNSENPDIAKFDSEADAAAAAQNNTLGEYFGYEVFEIGMGL